MQQSLFGFVFAALMLVLATPAAAYIGPGLGAGAIATVIGLLGAIVLLFVAVVYYPLKRMAKARNAKAVDQNAYHDSAE